MMKCKDIFVYDVEINRLLKGKEWGNINRTLFASAVVYSYMHDRFYFFLHPSSIESLMDLMNGGVAVSFNGVNFDSKVILGKERGVKSYAKTGLYVYSDGVKWIEYDLFIQCLKYVNNAREDVSARKTFSPGGLKLDDIAMCTLKAGKGLMQGSMAPTLYQQGKYDKLFEYNLNDVILTKGLFEHALKHGRIYGKGCKINVKVGRFRDVFFEKVL